MGVVSEPSSLLLPDDPEQNTADDTDDAETTTDALLAQQQETPRECEIDKTHTSVEAHPPHVAEGEGDVDDGDQNALELTLEQTAEVSSVQEIKLEDEGAPEPLLESASQAMLELTDEFESAHQGDDSYEQADALAVILEDQMLDDDVDAERLDSNGVEESGDGVIVVEDGDGVVVEGEAEGIALVVALMVGDLPVSDTADGNHPEKTGQLK